MIQLDRNYFIYYLRPGFHFTFGGSYSLIKKILSILPMTICGIWSRKNVRNIGCVRAAPNVSVGGTNTEDNSHDTSTKDRQLILMLFKDIITYVLFSFLLAIFLIYQQITQNYIKKC